MVISMRSVGHWQAHLKAHSNYARQDFGAAGDGIRRSACASDEPAM